MPRWTDERTARLPGRCRGDLLGPWGDNLRRRFGDDAVDRVRARMPVELQGISTAPSSKEWLPVEAQLRVTEAIVDEFLGGDAGALYALVMDDARRGSGRAQLAVLKALGPRRMFKLAPRTHRKVYDVGVVGVQTQRGRARIDFRDALLFGHPTWRLLQVYATSVLLELQGSNADVSGEDTGPDSFSLLVSWR